MYIAARERKILDILLTKTGETTVKELASALDVSSRTVHRDLKGVEEVLKEYDLGLTKRSGIGIQVTGDVEQKERLRLFLINLFHNEYTPEERQTIILSELLDSYEPVKLLSLANDLNVTIATISNDLNKIEEKIVPFQLTLLRKRGYGVEIRGTESNKRRAISHLISQYIDEFEFISIIKENIQKRSLKTLDTVTDRLLGLVDKKKLLIIEKQIDEIKDELPYSIADSSYIGLVVHLALAIERIEHGEKINFDEGYLESLRGTKEYIVAEKIVRELEEIFRIQISNGEIGYITMHLMGAKHRKEHDDLLEDSSVQVGILVQNLVRYVSNRTGHDLTKNMSLFQGLVAHLRPALYRIKQNMGISNPLLPQIERDYSEMFNIITEAMKIIFSDVQVPKEEVGYLVMHFASAVIKNKEEKKLETLVVCSSGIGTSKILSSKLESEIPFLKTTTASLFDLEYINVADYDAILSTVPLKNFNEDYLVVSPLLSMEDTEKIKRFLLEKRQLGRKGIDVNLTKDQHNSNHFLKTLKVTKNYSTAIYYILTGFSVNAFNVPLTINEVLWNMCEKLEEKNVLTNIQEVISELLKREEIGGLGITGTSMALFHARSEHVLLPSFTISRLAQPIEIRAMDGSKIKMNTVLLMLSPRDINNETLEILSGISSLIIRDEETMLKFQTSTEQTLSEVLLGELKKLYESKLN